MRLIEAERVERQRTETLRLKPRRQVLVTQTTGLEAMAGVSRIFVGALSALAVAIVGLSSAPVASASWSSNWPLCGTFSLFSDDQCDAIEYCINTDDPACQQTGTEPSYYPSQ